jgi:hypothetical protein
MCLNYTAFKRNFALVLRRIIARLDRIADSD